jgi:glutathione S-transferase
MSTDHALRRGGHGEGGVGGAGRPLPPLPARAALAAPLPLARDLEARIASLGAELPTTHKAVLWAGVGLDVASWPRLKAYRERIAARPRVQDAMRAEGLIK